MKIQMKHPHTIGKQHYPAGTHEVPDHMACNLKFKQLVRAGHARVLPRSEQEQSVQESKDQRNARKAGIAREMTAKRLADEANAKAAEVAEPAFALSPEPFVAAAQVSED